MSVLQLDGAAVAVTDLDGDSKTVLAPTSLTLTERRISVIGANGSGKSTLLRLLNGLVMPSEGSVTIDGLDTRKDGAKVRRRVGFVFTDPAAQLVMPTGREDVELSLRRLEKDPRARSRRAMAALERFGLAELAEQSVYELSGGERQLLAIATVLAVEPTVLVLDEPTTLLDLRNRELVRSLLAGLDQQMVLATHDLDLALDADRSLVIDDGRVAFDGSPAAAVAWYRQLVAAEIPLERRK
ncbi:ABC transporter ATP-binding protein [Saxibacter everestensis]|uniref:ABC transporter ATP-binding protein n=1 Tax=Saxibacter everestensis TaxID=2909229 RepID=A0ABY8QXH1_9MICO|nr:ABC transporter ATP-binding protein [Brevibacteriaceae bacterium ZFBP1038]